MEFGRTFMNRPSALMALTLALGATLSGCGGEEREYAVPKTLCDVPVDSSLLAPLLPPGKKVRVNIGHYSSGVPQENCEVLIDGEVWLTIYGRWEKAGVTALEATYRNRGRGLEHSSDNGKFVSWDRGAATVVACPSAKWKTEDFSIVASAVHRTEFEANEKAIKEFLVSYSEAFAAKPSCKSGT
ncbi:hypothetical protein ACFY7Z_04315 [Streptomyces sp. NPDC012623]|uniref:hypothetical protein n=1 Tax=unclassified Streptomyces TaxID=2593676 RepID=UPI0036CECD6F